MDPQIKLILGITLWGVFVMLGFFKKLRDDKTIIFLSLLTAIIAIYPLTKIIEGAPYSGNFRQTDIFFLPFFYVSTYGLLRQLYKSIYKREPTYYRASWFDPEDNREQNWLDIFVYVGSMAISFLIVVLIN